MRLSTKDRHMISYNIKHAKRDHHGLEVCVMIVSFFWRTCSLFVSAREVANFHLRFAVYGNTQRVLLLICCVICLMHMCKESISFWNVLDRLYFLCLSSPISESIEDMA